MSRKHSAVVFGDDDDKHSTHSADIFAEGDAVFDYDGHRPRDDAVDISMLPANSPFNTTTQTTNTTFSAEMMANLPAQSPTPVAGYSAGFQAYDAAAKFTLWSPSADVLQKTTVLEIQEHLGNSRRDEVVWIDVCAPQISDLHAIAETLGIHPLTIEDIQQEDSREKCEIYDPYLFLCVRTCTANYYRHSVTKEMLDEQGVNVGQSVNLYLLLWERRILSIHLEPIPHIRNALRRTYPYRQMTEVSADWILYALLDDIVDEFIPGMRGIEQEVDCIDDLVLMLRNTDQADMLRRIGHARKRVIRLLRLLKPKGEVIRTLYKRCPERLRPSTLLYLRDVQDHLITMMQALEQAAGTLDRSHSNYLAQINIELAEASNRMNFVVKKLTAAASLVLPLSLISGLWGMNVPVPGQPGMAWTDYGPFFVICSTMSVLMVAMFVYGRHYDWF